MSDLAVAHYTQLARTHQFPESLPEILNGTPQSLLPEDRALSILRPDPEDVAEATLKYDAIISSLAPFVITCAQDQPEKGTRSRTEIHDKATYGNHLKAMAPKLLVPKELSTGRLHKIQMQAIAPSEVSLNIATRTLGGQHTRVPEAISSWVFLITTAEHKMKTTATTLGYTAFLTIVHASVNGVPVCNGKQISAAALKIAEGSWKPT